MIEVWISEEDADRFYEERFMPALRALGLMGPPPAGALARAQRHVLSSRVVRNDHSPRGELVDPRDADFVSDS